ncbi:alkaline phosphatase family protein [Janthinobacterium agaricidamnosum]|uniref:Type I phosphodiesterase / nucleotide pyrophosphatase family protein n=1 Tax=Janthinobacterium agaricidamnosum NBRC 102515 = DSM 9628 TaxID=1349767 RepID=W0V4H8_9BURK|nr:alkaline phosphatase family protein [Janthinobacterium agaricidamnosum]CDG82177.1 type I phosphodiesterase / nucleotide pyrophosphatase family protein [Janthinobacterium agaricidamnosum NBRC 102515 = DSM 9628]
MTGNFPFFRHLAHALLLVSSAGAWQAHAAPASAAAAVAQPKLVLVLVVDGLPQEQVLRYRDQFGQGGLRRLLDQGAWFSDAHQAHGITVTAIGHSAVLTGAYPYQHGVIGNNWIDPQTKKSVYCTEDGNYTYIGEETRPSDGTSPAKLRVSTLGDELRYATGQRAKVIAISGKDRGAILLGGKTGTAYMYMDKTGNFASSTYYMQSHPEWVRRYQAGKPQDRYYGKTWTPLLADSAYANDASADLNPAKPGVRNDFPFSYYSDSGNLDADYYNRLKTGPHLDELTLDFARAAVAGENLGKNPAGVPDLLGISLSAHDYVNHAFGPESRMSHDHLQRLDRLLAGFFTYLDQRIGMDNVLVVLTADHGFPNTPEFSQTQHMDAQRLDGDKLMASLNQHLAAKFSVDKLVTTWSMPNIYLDYALADKSGIRRDDLENAAARFLMDQPGLAQVYTRTQMEGGAVATRMDTLMRRAWNRQLSGDLMAVTRPYWYFGTGNSGTSHGSPYAYDTNVPLIVMGKRWIRPGAYSQYAEVVDIAPTLAHVLGVRPPSAAEGRVLTETLR